MVIPDAVKHWVRQYPRLRTAIWYARQLPKNIYIWGDKYNHGYTVNHYINPTLESKDYLEKQGSHDVISSAMLYAVGYGSYDEQRTILERMQNRHHTEQAEILMRAAHHFPEYVIDVGGGRGELAAIMQAIGIDVTILDPSAGSADMVTKTASWFDQEIHHIPRPLKDIWSVLKRRPDCIIMSESIEHISAKELNVMLDGMPRPCRLVIVNHIDFWVRTQLIERGSLPSKYI